MLADYARIDGHRLRRVEPVERATRELGALVRARTSLVEARTAASNQAWAILAEHWPGAGVVFQKLISQVALDFLSDYPTPHSAALLGEGRMRQFCRRHAYRGGKSPAELLDRLRAAPTSANPGAPVVLAAIVRGSVAQIRVLNAEITQLERDLTTALAAHPKAGLLETLPRVANRYRRARERGARHPHAVRIVACGWIPVIWACWSTDTVYDPSRHRSEQLVATGT